MATPRMRVDREWLNTNVLQNPGVRAAITQTARRLAPIVQQIALREGDRDYANSVRVETGGTRPGLKSPTRIRRPQARVIIGDEHAMEKEHGTRIYPKKGFLRRAVRQL